MKRPFRSGLLSCLSLALMAGCHSPRQTLPQEVGHQSDALATPKQRAALDAKAQADVVLGDPDNIRAAKSSDQVFNYADKLLAQGNEPEAANYLAGGLRLSPWNLKEQLVSAHLLLKSGQTDAAKTKYEMVATYAEVGALRKEALLGLGKVGTWAEPEAARAIPGNGPAVVLAPVGTVETWLLRRLAAELTKNLGIPVYVMDLKTELGAAARSPRALWLRYLKENLKRNPNYLKVMQTLADAKGTDPAKMWDDDIFYPLFIEAVRKSENAEVAAGLEKENQTLLLEKEGGQWDAELLFQNVKKSTKPWAHDGVIFMGITEVDMFSGDHNYQFAASNVGFSVISYCRFTAKFNQATPNAERLVTRLKKTALSSVGFGFSIPRCTTPWCARAYPNSLEEQDAKEPWLCDICRENFRKAFLKYGWNKPVPEHTKDLGL
jgi:predicted Zn-dependent protease